MGLIKAAIGSAGGVLADQWKEFFVCDALPKDVLARKGEKKTSGRSSNTKGSDNVISDGSGLVVADGQCAIITDQGRVAEICAVPGEYTYNSLTEPSIFTGKFGEGLKNTFKNIGKRFTYGGEPPKDQRVYYFNTKEMMENLFGTANPVPFRVVDKNLGLDLDVSIRCSGVYSYTIADPILFYTNVCGNFQSGEYNRSELDKQLKAEFISKLQPAFGKLSDLEMRPNQIPNHTDELCDAMNEALTAKWGELRGLKVISIAINSLTLPDEDMEMIKQMQRTAAFRDPTMGAAHIVGAQGDAMRTAAGNQGGAMAGFMGMGMAMNAGGMNPQNLYAMGAQQQQQQAAQQAQQAQQQAAPAAPAAGAWTCPQCGKQATGKFCMECGAKKPEANGWTCSNCGTVNKGKFCNECGQKKPEGAPTYKCDKCGWEPEDPHHPPKFCPECGDIFDDNDKK
ncbi:MAG: SPFH domain-containing protein [Ruminococcus sp.]|nr:SPFH domain-containing protein [Ruminococcus sp.]